MLCGCGLHEHPLFKNGHSLVFYLIVFSYSFVSLPVLSIRMGLCAIPWRPEQGAWVFSSRDRFLE